MCFRYKERVLFSRLSLGLSVALRSWIHLLSFIIVLMSFSIKNVRIAFFLSLSDVLTNFWKIEVFRRPWLCRKDYPYSRNRQLNIIMFAFTSRIQMELHSNDLMRFTIINKFLYYFHFHLIQHCLLFRHSHKIEKKHYR